MGQLVVIAVVVEEEWLVVKRLSKAFSWKVKSCVQNRIEVQMHPWMLVETTRVTEFEYYFACTRKGVHLYSVMSPGKMTFAVLELWCIVVNIKYTSATTTSHVVITCGPYKVATKYVILNKRITLKFDF